MGVSKTQVVRFLKKGADAVSIIVSGDNIVFTAAGQVLVVSIEVYIGTEKLQYGSGSDNTFTCSTLSSGNKLFDGNGIWSFRIDDTNTKFTYLIGLKNKVDLSTTIPYTITINDIPYNKSISVSTVYKGERGATPRGPQDWESLNTGYRFYSGADGEPYLDFVVYKNNYYLCKKSHTKNSFNFPTSSFDNNSGLWQLSDKIDMVATQLLLATYAVIENLGVKYVEINSTEGYIKQTDENGNIIFLLEKGKITCNKGTFDNIDVKSGHIAGFKVSGNDLTNDPFKNDASIIFRNDRYGAFAGIGGNMLPIASGARGVARFENHDTTDVWKLGTNYAMLVSAQGTLDNRAIQIDGGSVTGFAMKNKIISDSGKNVVLGRFDYNVITINEGASCTITLPQMQIYDDGHVIRIKRLGSGGVNVNIGQCYNYVYSDVDPDVDPVLKLTYPVIIKDQGDAITHTGTLRIDSVCDSMELVWCRDLSPTVNGVKYYGAWVQYKMPRDW